MQPSSRVGDDDRRETLSRRQWLATTTAGIGTALTGCSGFGSDEAVEFRIEAWLYVRDDGTIEYLLGVDTNAELPDDPADLLSVAGSGTPTPTDDESVQWNAPATGSTGTDVSLGDFSDGTRAEAAEQLGRDADRINAAIGPDSGSRRAADPDPFGYTFEDDEFEVFTGEIRDAVETEPYSDENLETERIRMPKIRYADGFVEGHDGFDDRVHLRFPDGVVYTYPRERGRFSKQWVGQYDMDETDERDVSLPEYGLRPPERGRSQLVPAIDHVNHEPLGSLQAAADRVAQQYTALGEMLTATARRQSGYDEALNELDRLARQSVFAAGVGFRGVALGAGFNIAAMSVAVSSIPAAVTISIVGQVVATADTIRQLLDTTPELSLDEFIAEVSLNEAYLNNLAYDGVVSRSDEDVTGTHGVLIDGDADTFGGGPNYTRTPAVLTLGRLSEYLSKRAIPAITAGERRYQGGLQDCEEMLTEIANQARHFGNVVRMETYERRLIGSDAVANLFDELSRGEVFAGLEDASRRQRTIVRALMTGESGRASEDEGTDTDDRNTGDAEQPGTGPGGDWPLYRHDRWNSGAPGTPGPTARPTERWEFETDHPVETGPAVVDETAFVLSGSWVDEGTVHALSTGDGTERWSADVGGVDVSAPAAVDGTVYVGGREKRDTDGAFGGYTGVVYALAADDGSQLWRFEAKSDTAVSSPPTVYDGRVYVRDANGHLYALEAESGTDVWSVNLNNRGVTWDSFAFAPVVTDDRVYIGTLDGTVYALSREDGSELWDTQVGDSVLSSPSLADGTLYVGDRDGLTALSTADGSEQWSYGVGASSPVRAPPAVLDGTVYAGVGGRLAALNATDGSELWYDYTGRHVQGVVVTDGTAYLSNGSLLAYSLADQTQSWKYDAGAIYASPVVADGTVYVGDRNGSLIALTE